MIAGVYGLYRGYIGGYIGIMEKKMEATTQGLGFRVDVFLIAANPKVWDEVDCAYLASGQCETWS